MHGLSGVDVHNATAVAIYYETHAIPQRFNSGIIIASIVVSILGSYASLYLLGKRTSNSGPRNIALLILAATTMAFVGIWSMHFIGMYMRLEATEDINWYIRYNPGFAVFSFIAPAIALIVSFLFLDHDTDGFRLWKASLAGTLTGCTVALMHYSASFYCNFNVTFAPAQTVGSILLACVLCIVGFTAFFRFRYQWQDSWWKRGACAISIGLGVSGMHYVGVNGTSYKVKWNNMNGSNLTTGNERNLILVCVIGAVCFAILSAIAVAAICDTLMNRKSRKNARRVVVASVTFDRTGRLMVNGDGTLPLTTVEEETLRRSEVLQALGQRSAVFHWLYAISWDWSIVLPFLEAINIKQFDPERKSSAKRHREILARFQKAKWAFKKSAKDIDDDPMIRQTSLLDFRDKVIDAASRLAQDLGCPLPDMGVFYDHVLPTGTRKAVERAQAKDPFRGRQSLSMVSDAYSDDETKVASRPPSIFGKGEEEAEGVTMFLVREVQQEEVVQLAKRGYRFTETRFLSNILAERHGVVKEEMDTTLEGLQQYAKRGIKPIVQPGGYYAGLFCVRSNHSHQTGNLDVLVYDFARHQIPAFRLPTVTALTAEILFFLKSLDKAPMEKVLLHCHQDSTHLLEQKTKIMKLLALTIKAEDKARLQEEHDAIDALMQFQQSLFTAINTLQQSMYFLPDLLQKATFSSKMVELPSSLNDPAAAPAHLVLMQAMLPFVELPRPGQSFEPTLPLVFIPYSLFAKTQMMMLRGPPAEDFERQVVAELERRYKLQTTSREVAEGKTPTYEEDEKAINESAGASSSNSPETHVLTFDSTPKQPTGKVLAHRLSVLGEESLVIGDDSVHSICSQSASATVEAALRKQGSQSLGLHLFGQSESSNSIDEMQEQSRLAQPLLSRSSAAKLRTDDGSDKDNVEGIELPERLKGGPESPLSLANDLSSNLAAAAAFATATKKGESSTSSSPEISTPPKSS